MHKKINSLQNPALKKILRLQEKARERKKENLFVIEGLREVKLAIRGGYEIVEIYFCPELLSENERNFFDGFVTVEIPLEAYKKIAYRGESQGIIALAKTKELVLENLQLPKNPLILVAEAPEKPGNLGALLRTADAAALDAVIIADPQTDLYNPNIVRSSLGGLFTNQLAVGKSSEVIHFLEKNNIGIYAGVSQQSTSYSGMDFSGPSALAVGTEAFGLSAQWRGDSIRKIHIPMGGEIDSLNVSVAAGILIFEAKRQRKPARPAGGFR